MALNDPESDAFALEETREESVRGIANALEFLREEAAAAGMPDVGLLISLARARALNSYPAAGEIAERQRKVSWGPRYRLR